MSDSPILIVDDDSALLALLKELLELEGLRVRTATNGAAALQIVENERPSLVVLDLRMPVLDGWSFSRILRARGEATPILVLTAVSDPRVQVEDIGADDYLSKPFDLDRLLAAVRRLTRGGRTLGASPRGLRR